MEVIMETTFLPVIYSGVSVVKVNKSITYPDDSLIALVYLTSDVDRAQAPLSISMDQAKQVYSDLKAFFNEE